MNPEKTFLYDKNYRLIKFPKKNQKLFRKSVIVCNLEQKPI